MKVSLVGKRDAVSYATLFLLWVAVWAPRLQGPIDLRPDASIYYTLGRSLAEGSGYRLLNEPGEIESVQYPPVLPLVVAGTIRLAGSSDPLVAGWWLRLLYFGLSGVYLLVSYRLIRTNLGPAASLLLTALLGCSYFGFLYISDTLHSELPFAFLTTVFLLWHRRSSSILHDIVAGVLGWLIYLVRTAGLVLLVAWVLESVLRRRLRQAALRATMAAIPITLWQTHIHRVMASEELAVSAYPYQLAPYYYTNVSYAVNASLKEPFRPEAGEVRLRDLLVRPIRHLTAMPLVLGETVWVPPSMGPTLAALASRPFGVAPSRGWREFSSLLMGIFLVLTGGLIFLGVIRYRRDEPFLALYFAMSIGMIVLTPWDIAFNRYLAPLSPLSLLFLAMGLSWCAGQLAKNLGAAPRVRGVVDAALLAMMLMVQVVYGARLLTSLQPVSFYRATGEELQYRLLTYEAFWHALDPAFEYVRAHAKPDDVLATSAPHLAYLRTGHKAVLPPFEPSHETANFLLHAVPVSYVVLDSLPLGISQRYAAPAVAARPDIWRLVFATPDDQAQVYERVR